MTSQSCCDNSAWSPERDLGHADTMEFVLGKCFHCGATLINVFSVATGISGYEPVTPTDAQQMSTISAGPELKRFMRSWSRTHI